MAATEIEIKLRRVGEFLERHRIDGVLLTERANFAWITGGRDNRQGSNAPIGCASILATRGERICIASVSDGPRMEIEELAGSGIRVVQHSWGQLSAAEKAYREVIGGRRIMCDVDPAGLGLSALPAGFVVMPWTLTDSVYDAHISRRVGALSSGAHGAVPSSPKLGRTAHIPVLWSTACAYIPRPPVRCLAAIEG